MTAGINAQIQNILIGQVSDIISSVNDLSKRAAIISPVDFSNLGFVFLWLNNNSFIFRPLFSNWFS